MQPSHLFTARLPLLAPLRPLPVALRGRLLLACRRRRHDSRRQAEPGGSAQGAGVPVEHPTQRLGRIHHQVPAVGDLRCLRRARADAFGVSARAVTADDSNILAVLPQPGGQCLAGAIRQQVDNPAAFKIADDSAVALAAPPGPVIHTEDTRRWRDAAAARADQPQQGIAADWHRQPASQSRPRLTAKGKADVLLDVAQPHGAPCLRPRNVQAFGEDAAPTLEVYATETPGADLQFDNAPLPWQVGQTSRIEAMHAATRTATHGASGAGAARARNEEDAIRGG